MFLSFSLPIVPQSVSPNAAADKETRRLGTTGNTPPSLPQYAVFASSSCQEATQRTTAIPSTRLPQFPISQPGPA